MNYTEILGVATGIAGVYLTMKENVWCFPVGLINVLVSMVLFYRQNLYADTLQQIVYVILLTYGWQQWISGAKKNTLKISRSSNLLWLILASSVFGCTLLLGYVLSSSTNASMPWTDSAATSVSFAAQWMIAAKKIENWILWMAVNITYTAIYFVKGLPLYSFLFAGYFILAVWGYHQWKKQLAAYEYEAR